MAEMLMSKKIVFFGLFLGVLLFGQISWAENIKKNTAHLQAMDKITGRVSVIDVPVNGEKEFGSLSIVIRSCQTRPAEEAPDNFAFADITDKNLQGEEFNIFKGWMISSSPATHAVEHPIYDVWLLKCEDTKVDQKELLSEEQLIARDNIAKQYEKVKIKQSSQGDSRENLAEPISEMPDEETRSSFPETSEPRMMGTEFSYDEDEVDENMAEDEISLIEKNVLTDQISEKIP